MKNNMLEDKGPKRRSPGFPSISLPRAVQLASRIYAAAFDSSLDTSTALELMGFRGISGASRTALSSLKQFGLLEGRDADNRVTKLAAQILHPVEDIERLSAIIEASRKPNIYNEIFNQFKGGLPEDKIIKAFLIRHHGFSDVGADTLIKCLRETEDYVSPLRVKYHDIISPSEASMTESVEHSSRPMLPEVKREEAIDRNAEVMKVRLGPGCEAVVSLVGDVNQKAISKLVAFLELAKDSYPE